MASLCGLLLTFDYKEKVSRSATKSLTRKPRDFLKGCVRHTRFVHGHHTIAKTMCQAQNVCFMNTIRLAERLFQTNNVCFINITRLAEWVCQAQNVGFRSTTNSFQNIFLSNKYVHWLYFIWQLSWLTSRWLASFIKPRRAINNVSVGCHNFLRAEDKHFQHLFWTRRVTCIISNVSAYRPISWTLC